MRTILNFLVATMLMLPAGAQMISCAQAKPALEKVTNFTNTIVFDAALNALKSKIRTDAAHEHILAFGRTDNGTVIASAIGTGGKSNSSIPSVPDAFADLHSHPRNTPPSSGDLYGLLYKNKKQQHYDTRYVITPDGIVYALVVTDTTAARLFLEKFPPQQTPGFSPLFPDKLLDEFREIKYLHGAPEEVAMAYMLEKYNTGVFLLKQDGTGAFKKLHVSATVTDNKIVFTNHACE